MFRAEENEMEASIMTKEEIAAKFAAGGQCAQCTLVPWAEALGYDEDELMRMAAAFAGGMFRGDTCGAVCGALMALGLAYGDDPALTAEKTAQFQEAFIGRFGGTACRDILGFDFSKPGELEKARESGKMLSGCTEFVRFASETLQELMRDA